MTTTRTFRLALALGSLSLVACEGTMTSSDVDGGVAVDAASARVDAPSLDASGPDAFGADAYVGEEPDAPGASIDAWRAPGPTLRPPPSETVTEAIAAPLGWFGQNSSGERYCAQCDGASIVLAVASFTGDDSADARLLEQIRHILGGNRDPFGAGGYLAQWERTMTGMLAIARRTPRVWDALSADEQHRADLVMQATLVASAYTTADRSYEGGAAPTGIDGDTNLHRGWNPNYREGMVGAMIVSTLYLGGGAAAHTFLDAYDHDAFVAALEAADLRHLHTTFETSGAPTGDDIAEAITDYRYLGHDLDALPAIFVALTEDTFSGEVACGIEGGLGRDVGGGVRSGVIVEGCDELPNLGAIGQLKELDSSDANGPRSSITYAWDGFKPNLVNHLVLLAYDALPRDAALDAAMARARIGATDVFYKAEHGYRSYARGRDRGVFMLPADGRGDGYEMYRPLWDEVVAPRY